MVPGLAAVRPAHPGADLRPPLDEGADDGVAQVVAGGAGGGRHPPQDHRHGLFVKHKLQQGEPLRNGGGSQTDCEQTFAGAGGWEERDWRKKNKLIIIIVRGRRRMEGVEGQQPQLVQKDLL